MAAITFLADADLNQNIVGGLRRRELSIDLLDAHEGGIIGLSDPEVLLIAARAGRVVTELPNSPGLPTKVPSACTAATYRRSLGSNINNAGA